MPKSELTARQLEQLREIAAARPPLPARSLAVIAKALRRKDISKGTADVTTAAMETEGSPPAPRRPVATTSEDDQ